MTTNSSSRIYQVLSELPENNEDVPDFFYEFNAIDIAKTIQANTVMNELPDATYSIKDGKNHYPAVLNDLERLKDQLGGSPFFGSKRPTIDNDDNRKVFFGIPMPAIKDWFRKALKQSWPPPIFWKKIAEMIHVTKNDMSSYEEAHVRIQRFGMLVENMAYFQEILNQRDEDRYSELCKITGLAWHPTQNAPEIEKMYMEFVDKFLTDYYEDAKQKGDEALVEYFRAFEGVCFEDRARALEHYARAHPLAKEAEETTNIAEVGDWSESNKVDDVWMKETVLLATKLQKAPSPTELFNHLQEKHIFDLAFMTENGQKVKPTKEEFQKWVEAQIDMCILEEEPDQETSYVSRSVPTPHI